MILAHTGMLRTIEPPSTSPPAPTSSQPSPYPLVEPGGRRTCTRLGFRVLGSFGFRVLGLGFEGLRVWGFWGLGFRFFGGEVAGCEGETKGGHVRTTMEAQHLRASVKTGGGGGKNLGGSTRPRLL